MPDEGNRVSSTADRYFYKPVDVEITEVSRPKPKKTVNDGWYRRPFRAFDHIGSDNDYQTFYELCMWRRHLILMSKPLITKVEANYSIFTREQMRERFAVDNQIVDITDMFINKMGWPIYSGIVEWRGSKESQREHRLAPDALASLCFLEINWNRDNINRKTITDKVNDEIYPYPEKIANIVANTYMLGRPSNFGIRPNSLSVYNTFRKYLEGNRLKL